MPVTSAAQKLEALRVRVSTRNDVGVLSDYIEYLAVTPRSEGFDLAFYGSPFEESYIDLLTSLDDSEVAGSIRSLRIAGPDEGANGTKHWDLEPLLATRCVFERLESFSIELDGPGNHNRSIVANSYDENGVIARLVERSPHLRHLQVPSAPDASLFAVGSRPIQILSVDAGYDTQDFIFNLSRSTNLSLLRCLEWGEYNETYMDDWRVRCTPFEAYRSLFRSAAFQKVSRLVWRNPVCSEAEMSELKAMRKDLELLVVHQAAYYA